MDMTSEQVSQWFHERDLARSISDEKEREIAIQKVYDLKDEMMMTCIQHQADRVKLSLNASEKIEKRLTSVEGKLDQLDNDLIPLKDSDKKFREMKLKAEGMSWSVKAFIAVGSVVGFETLKNILEAIAKATQ